jgi:hypothetical protein
MQIYYCWITALLPSYQDGIVSGLASKGYMVGPAAKNGKVIFSMKENDPACVIALSVYKPDDLDMAKLYDDIVAILTDMKAYCFSIVISLSTHCTWIGSNFELPPKQAATKSA